MKDRISVIIPAHNCEVMLRSCLDSLARSKTSVHECIVVDDGSSPALDPKTFTINNLEVTWVRLQTRSGPAHARNAGAAIATGNILLFLDSDVAISPHAVTLISERFEEDSKLDALFGAYDDWPSEKGLVSEFRNLLHTYVHRSANRISQSFWAGCGAVRRELFIYHGGFDSAFQLPCVEDIEFGMRLARGGAKVALMPEVQGKHMKRWTFWNMVKTDILQRGIPWTRLILASGQIPNDLNLRYSSRISVALVMSLCFVMPLFFAFAPFSAPVLQGMVWHWLFWGQLVTLVLLNWPFLRFLLGRRSVRFSLACGPLYFVYFLCCGLGFAAGTWMHLTSDLKLDPEKKLRSSQGSAAKSEHF
jgi:GT2 family glycosyltransferase